MTLRVFGSSLLFLPLISYRCITRKFHIDFIRNMAAQSLISADNFKRQWRSLDAPPELLSPDSAKTGGALVTDDLATSFRPRTDPSQSGNPLSPKSIVIDFINTRSDYKVRFLWKIFVLAVSLMQWCIVAFTSFDQINKCILWFLLSISSRNHQGVLS